MRLRRAAPPLALLALTLSGALHAQDADPGGQLPLDINSRDGQKRAGDRNLASASLLSAGSPDDRAMAGFFAPNITFSTEDDETSVSLAFSFDLQRYTPKFVEVRDGSNFYNVSRTKLSIVASAPIEGEASFGSLFSGDSLVSGSKIKLAFSNLSNTTGDGAGAEDYLASAYRDCILDEAEEWLRLNDGKGLTASSYLATVDAERGAWPQDFRITLERRETAPAASDLDKRIAAQCAPGSVNKGRRYGNAYELVRHHGTDGEKYRALFFDDRSWFRFFGADASVGQDKYKYMDSVAFEEPEVSRTSWEVGAYAGLINWNSTFSARARVVYGKSWKLPEDGETCHPVGNDEHCVSGPDGPPGAVKTGLISLETRHLFLLDDEHRIALAPQLTHRFEDDALGVEVPVYLAPDEGGNLTGGLKFAYNSKGDDFGIGLFVGVPFSIFFD